MPEVKSECSFSPSRLSVGLQPGCPKIRVCYHPCGTPARLPLPQNQVFVLVLTLLCGHGELCAQPELRKKLEEILGKAMAYPVKTPSVLAGFKHFSSLIAFIFLQEFPQMSSFHLPLIAPLEQVL